MTRGLMAKALLTTLLPSQAAPGSRATMAAMSVCGTSLVDVPSEHRVADGHGRARAAGHVLVGTAHRPLVRPPGRGKSSE